MKIITNSFNYCNKNIYSLLDVYNKSLHDNSLTELSFIEPFYNNLIIYRKKKVNTKWHKYSENKIDNLMYQKYINPNDTYHWIKFMPNYNIKINSNKNINKYEQLQLTTANMIVDVLSDIEFKAQIHYYDKYSRR